MPLQTWKPDTCGCIIEERHGDGLGVRFERVIEKCSIHTAVADADLYGVIYGNADGENKRKNLVEKALRETTSLNLGTQNAEGAWEWRAGRGFAWTWVGVAPARVLQVSIVGATLTTAQRNTAQTWCDTAFGAGKVVVL